MNMPVDTLADPIAAHAQAMIAHLGEDPRRAGLAETPARFAAAMASSRLRAVSSAASPRFTASG